MAIKWGCKSLGGGVRTDGRTVGIFFVLKNLISMRRASHTNELP